MKIAVTPRDAMQGKKEIIPVKLKVEYINLLLKAGFDIVDFGSFVSPKAVPQMKDSSEVLDWLEVPATTKLMAIIGNLKGAEIGSVYEKIHYFGYPFSGSPTFLKLNINSTIDEAFRSIDSIQNVCGKSGKELVIYYSLAFGNPYGDPHDDEQTIQTINRLIKSGIRTISLADTTGDGDTKVIADTFELISSAFPQTEFGLHLHNPLEKAMEKVEAAIQAGCSYFDTAPLGMGGCPMSARKMVGNLSTEQLLDYLESKNIPNRVNREIFNEALKMATIITGYN